MLPAKDWERLRLSLLRACFLWAGDSSEETVKGRFVGCEKIVWTWRDERLFDLRKIRFHDRRDSLLWPEKPSIVFGDISISISVFEFLLSKTGILQLLVLLTCLCCLVYVSYLLFAREGVFETFSYKSLIYCGFDSKLKSQFILLFNLYLLLFMGSTALFGIFHGFYCTISTNFYFYL